MPRPAQDPRVWYGEFGRGIVRRVLTPWIQGLGVAEQEAVQPLEAQTPLPGPAGMEPVNAPSGAAEEGKSP
jgi:hypothetical protein